MAAYYSLISSLPSLVLTETPLITMAEFTASAESFVTGSEREILERLAATPDGETKFPRNSLAYKYVLWEKALRNSVVKQRAAKGAPDALSSVRDTDFESSADRAAVQAYASANPLEREKILDAARFAALDEMCACQVFSFDIICAYKLKLAIAWKWASRKDRAKADSMLSKTVERVLASEKKTENK